MEEKQDDNKKQHMDDKKFKETLRLEIIKTVDVFDDLLHNNMGNTLLFNLAFCISIVVCIECFLVALEYIGIHFGNNVTYKEGYALYLFVLSVCSAIVLCWRFHTVTKLHETNKLLKTLIRAEQNIRLSEIELKKFEKKPYKVEVKINK